MNEINWKPASSFLPEFDIDYKSARIVTLVESKPIGKTKEKAFYYPGFTFEFRVVRDPLPKLLKSFFPSIILGGFLVSVYHLSIYNLANRLTLLSVTLLTYIAIM